VTLASFGLIADWWCDGRMSPSIRSLSAAQWRVLGQRQTEQAVDLMRSKLRERRKEPAE